jgi:hypothetical protein
MLRIPTGTSDRPISSTTTPARRVRPRGDVAGDRGGQVPRAGASASKLTGLVGSLGVIVGSLALGLFFRVLSRCDDGDEEWERREREDAVAAGEQELRRLEGRWEEECALDRPPLVA